MSDTTAAKETELKTKYPDSITYGNSIDKETIIIKLLEQIAENTRKV